MLLGYARVSTDQQDHALQLDALRAAGCDKVFVETGSGTRTDRPELAKVDQRVFDIGKRYDHALCTIRDLLYCGEINPSWMVEATYVDEGSRTSNAMEQALGRQLPAINRVTGAQIRGPASGWI